MTCSYAHRMKTTRGHAPILEVVAAAGVQVYAPRSMHHDSVEADAWRQHVYSSDSKREKRRDCDNPEWCNADMPYEGGTKRSGSTTAGRAASRRQIREVTEDTDSEGGRERPRQQQQAALGRSPAQHVKKSPRTYRVANPDRVHPARTKSTEKYEMWRPSKTITDQTQDGFNREEDEAYMLTHEVLSYAFGNRNVN
jgi:hypothetical protein